MIDIHFDATAFVAWLRRAGEEAQANARQTLGQGVALALAHAKATQSFHDRTGELRKSITRGQKSTWVHFLKASAKHAAYVEYGTKDSTKGPITAKNGGALRFHYHGALMFRRSVKHKGMKARHFMDDAATVGARFLDWRMEDAIARAFR